MRPTSRGCTIVWGPQLQSCELVCRVGRKLNPPPWVRRPHPGSQSLQVLVDRTAGLRPRTNSSSSCVYCRPGIESAKQSPTNDRALAKTALVPKGGARLESNLLSGALLRRSPIRGVIILHRSTSESKALRLSNALQRRGSRSQSGGWTGRDDRRLATSWARSVRCSVQARFSRPVESRALRSEDRADGSASVAASDSGWARLGTSR